MKHLTPNFQQLNLDDRSIVADQLVTFLRGKYPVNKWHECVAADFKISPETVANWEKRKSLPEALTIRRMVMKWGIEFLCVFLPTKPRWLDGAERAERLARLVAEKDLLEQELRELQQI